MLVRLVIPLMSSGSARKDMRKSRLLVLLGFVPIDCRVSILGITIMIWGSIPHNST